MNFRKGDRVKPSAEALELHVWCMPRRGVKPEDRRGRVVRDQNFHTVAVAWDPPVGSGTPDTKGTAVHWSFLERIG